VLAAAGDLDYSAVEYRFKIRHRVMRRMKARVEVGRHSHRRFRRSSGVFGRKSSLDEAVE